MKKTIIYLFVALMPILSSGQNYFKKIFPYAGYPDKMLMTSDSGFIILCAINGHTALLKLNSDGDSVWSKIYDSIPYFNKGGLKISNDGNLLMFSQGNFYKLNSSGEIIWKKSFPGTRSAEIAEGKNGRIIIATADSGNPCVIVTDSQGNEILRKIIDYSLVYFFHYCTSIVPSSDSLFRIMYSYDHFVTFGVNSYCYEFVFRDMNFSDFVPAVNYDTYEIQGLIYLKKRSIISLIGYHAGFLGSHSKGMIMKYLDDEPDWMRSYSDFDEESFLGGDIDNEGNYTLTGYAKNSSLRNNNILITKTDSLGNLIWNRTYDKGYGTNLICLDDGTIVSCGIQGKHNDTVYVLKTSSSGSISGISDNTSGRIRVFPNPCSNSLSVEWNSNELTSEIEIIDAHGIVVKTIIVSEENTNKKISADVSDLSEGLYISRINTGKGYITGKITISR